MSTYREIYDQFGGVVRRVEYNPYAVESRQGGDMHFVTEQDCSGIVAANKRDADVDQRKRQFRLAARVPLAVVERAMREGWFNDKAAWKKWLNDGENRDFRVIGGRI
ncbi:hypothetical protein [Microcystis phage MJing1]|nr:hypothetical protein [Microcystis phage MJing1]